MPISSYDENAKRPKIGSRWVWEPDSHPELIVVTGVIWNGEEWWIRTHALAEARLAESLRGAGHLNDLGRFWEACHGIIAKAGPKNGPDERSGPPIADELAALEAGRA